MEAFLQGPQAELRIYGFDRAERKANYRLMRTSTVGFLQDLASCRAAAATTGFPLNSGCLHFRKPMLLVPLCRQYEQELNAHHVQALGRKARRRDFQTEQLREFLEETQRAGTTDGHAPGSSGLAGPAILGPPGVGGRRPTSSRSAFVRRSSSFSSHVVTAA